MAMMYQFFISSILRMTAICCSLLLAAVPARGGDPACQAGPPEPHAAVILAEILQAKQAILARGGPQGSPLDPAACLFLTYWDFDGTVLKGDCTEGLVDAGKPAYLGLFESCVRGGHVAGVTPDAAGFAAAFARYRDMEEHIGPWLAYPYLAQALYGANAREIEDLAARHFRTCQQPWTFSSSLAIMRGLRAAGIEVRVISASPHVFLQGIAREMPEISMATGIRTLIRDGKITNQLDYPVTYAEGKATLIDRQLESIAREQPGKHCHVLAGFGNSHGTDGPFLPRIANMSLPAGGSPVVVMINGGNPPPQYAKLFRTVNQHAVTGSVKP